MSNDGVDLSNDGPQNIRLPEKEETALLFDDASHTDKADITERVSRLYCTKFEQLLGSNAVGSCWGGSDA